MLSKTIKKISFFKAALCLWAAFCGAHLGQAYLIRSGLVDAGPTANYFLIQHLKKYEIKRESGKGFEKLDPNTSFYLNTNSLKKICQWTVDKQDKFLSCNEQGEPSTTEYVKGLLNE